MGYKDGAPTTELFKSVHAPNVCAKRIEAANEWRLKRHGAAALQDLAVRAPSVPSRQRLGVRQPHAAFVLAPRKVAMAFYPAIAILTSATKLFRRNTIHDANAVLPAKLVGLPVWALRIIAPLAIHQQTILITAGHKRNRLFPRPRLILFQTQRRFLPAGKIPGEQN